METIFPVSPSTPRTTFVYDRNGLHTGMVLPSGVHTSYQYGAVREWPSGNGHRQTPSEPEPVAALTRGEMDERYGRWPGGPLCLGWTQPDTEVVMQLLLWKQPTVIVEIGAARGDMTANLVRYSPEQAWVYYVDICQEMRIAVPEAQIRSGERLPRKEVGAHTFHFGNCLRFQQRLGSCRRPLSAPRFCSYLIQLAN